MSKPRLLYFDIAGRAFRARVCLFKALGKEGWTDERVSGDDWKADDFKLKKSTPLGSMPVLYLPDGTTIVQSIAIANWAAKKAGMYPTDGDKAGLVDMVMLCSEEALSGAPQAGNSPETLKQRREEFANGALRKLMGVMNDNLKGPFLLGDELCVADLGIYGNVDMIAGGRLDHVPGDYVAKNFPKLVEHYEAVKQHPTLKAYWAAYKN